MFLIYFKRELLEKYSHLDIYRSLAKLRQNPSFLTGNFSYLIVTDDVFSFIRHAPGSQSFIVAMNLGDRDLNVNLYSSNKIPKTAELVLQFGKSPRETDSLYLMNPKHKNFTTGKVYLKPKSLVVLSYNDE